MSLGYAKVRINITALIIDGADVDDIPEDQALTAILTLDPMIAPGSMMQYEDGGLTKLKALTQFQVTIGATGDVEHYGRDYVKVPAPTAAESNIAELQWRATFTDIKYGQLRINKIDPIFFYAHPGQDINLADHVNVAPSPIAEIITRGPRGYGIIGALDVDHHLVLVYGSDAGPVESAPIALPAGPPGSEPGPGSIGTSKLANDGVTSPKLSPEVRAQIAAGGTPNMDAITDAQPVGKALVRATSKSVARSAIDAVSQAEIDTAIAALRQLITGGTVDAALDTLVEIAAKLSADDTALAGLLTAVNDRYTKAVMDQRRQETIDALAGKADTQLFLALLDSDFVRKNTRGVANGVATLDANGLVPTAQLPASSGGGGNDPRYVHSEWTIGDGVTAGPYNITHNHNSRSLDVSAYRLALPCETLAGLVVERPSKDAIVIRTDVALPKCRVLIRALLGTSDVTPPTTPSAAPTSSAKTTTTIDTAAVAATDPSGIAGYNWFRDNTYAGTSTGVAFQFTGLTAGQQYAITYTVVDGAMNESAKSPALTITTTASAPDVARIKSARGRSVNAGTAAVDFTPAPGNNKKLLAFVTLSHAAWQSEASLDVKTVADGTDGTWTKEALTEYATEQTGQLWLFSKVPTNLGNVRTITANCGKSGMGNAHLIIDVVELDNVASLGTPVTNSKNNGNLNPVSVTVPTKAGDMVVAELVSSDGSNHTPASGTPAFLQNTTNGDMDGTFDQASLVSSTTTGTSITYATAQTKYATAAIGVNVVRAT